jgi:type IV secretory pathway VirB10-like protein
MPPVARQQWCRSISARPGPGLIDSRVGYGQDGIQVVWSRLIFPDGSSINLEGMAGQDASGHAGLRHDVDNHYKRLVGFGLLTSAFSAAFQLSQTRRGTVLGYPSAAETVLECRSIEH